MDEAQINRGWTFEELLELDGLGPIERPDRDRERRVEFVKEMDRKRAGRPGSPAPRPIQDREVDLFRPRRWSHHRWTEWRWEEYQGRWAPIRDVAAQHGYNARNLYRYVETGRLPAVLCPRCRHGFKKLIPNDPAWLSEAAGSAHLDKMAHLARARWDARKSGGKRHG